MAIFVNGLICKIFGLEAEYKSVTLSQCVQTG